MCLCGCACVCGSMEDVGYLVRRVHYLNFAFMGTFSIVDLD